MLLESAAALSDRDQHALATAAGKFQVVRDMVAQVALGFSNGVYIYGPGGCGKSYQTLDELDRLSVPYRLANSRMTGLGLFETLCEYPDEIHVLEDMESITRDKRAQGVLRSALWGQSAANTHGRRERSVTWTTGYRQQSVTFTGGIIMLANQPLGDVPELNAVRTRIGYWQLHLSAQEIIAIMRAMASQGYQHGRHIMSSGDCSEVCEFVIKESLALERGLDLRMLTNAYGDYLQWQDGLSGCHWHDLTTTRIKERPIGIGETVSVLARNATKEKEREIANEIRDLPRDERVRVWREWTGKSEPTYYRRLEEFGN